MRFLAIFRDPWATYWLVSVAKEGKVLEQKILLQPLLGTPEGFEMGCIICFPTSAPSVVHPTVYVGKLKLNFVHRTTGLQNILEPKRRNMRFTAEREEKANYNARSATKVPAFPGGYWVSSSRSEKLKSRQSGTSLYGLTRHNLYKETASKFISLLVPFHFPSKSSPSAEGLEGP